MAENGQIHAVGRRKEAVCRIYLRPGSGKWDINGRTLGDYFPRPALVSAIMSITIPFCSSRADHREDEKWGCQRKTIGRNIHVESGTVVEPCHCKPSTIESQRVD